MGKLKVPCCLATSQSINLLLPLQSFGPKIIRQSRHLSRDKEEHYDSKLENDCFHIIKQSTNICLDIKKKETVFGFRTRKLEVLLFWRESWFKRHQKALPTLQPISKRTCRDIRWWELSSQDSMQTIDTFLKQRLWHNSLIKVKDKTIYNKN